MSGPWEKYQKTAMPDTAAQRSGPWRKYAQAPAPKTPDGRTTAPGTTAEQAADIPLGMIYDERTGGYVDTAAAAERMGKAQGAGASFLAGAPFVGESVDEALGAADAALTGRNPEIAQETFRQSREQFQQSNPGTALAAEMAGGVAGSLPLIGPGVNFVAKGANALTQGVRAVAAGGAAGAADGAARGYGRGRTREDRSQKARGDAIIGGGIGAAMAPVAATLGYGAKEFARRVKRLDIRVIADEFGISHSAARVVQRALRNDDLDAAERALMAAGDDAMLADAGQATGALLDASIASGGTATRIGREAVTSRAEAAGQRLRGRLDTILGSVSGRRSTQRNIARRTAGVRGKAYDLAYSKPIDYASEEGRAIEGVLGRVPPSTMQAAISEANEAMTEAGTRNMQIMAEITKDGVKFREMPNVQQLDQLKQALATVARNETDSVTGKISPAGVRARRLASDLGDALGEAVPAYRRAVRLGGDKIAEENAYQTGVDLLKRSVTLEDVQEIAARATSAEAKLAAKRGVRRGIENTLANVRRTMTDGSTDAREALQLLKDLSSRESRAKVAALLGDDTAKQLFEELDRVAPALELRAAVAANSKTAIRQAIQDQVAEESAPGALRRFVGEMGSPLEAGRELSRALVRTDGSAVTERQRQLYAEIAEALVGKRGREAQKALRIVRGAINGQPINDAQARLIGNAVGRSVFAAGYQSTKPLQGN